MDGIVGKVSGRRKAKFRRRARETQDAGLRTRYLIVVNLAEAKGVAEVSQSLNVAPSTVRRVARRFLAQGEAGLVDRREGNGGRKVDDDFLGLLAELVRGNPQEFDWKRPTWTQEMLVETMFEKLGVRVSVGTMSRALKQLGARLGRPKPTVNCPWSKARKARRLNQIRRQVEHLPRGQVAYYVDEVDIHLNPKIGPDWMMPGQQKEAPTPGQNEKRYLAGAFNPATQQMICVEHEQKDTFLFLMLLWQLVQSHPDADVIHVVLDNYSIHHTLQVELALESESGQKIKLHFLPPYCPDHNKIERCWRELHANVTRNHRCADMGELMIEVRDYLARTWAAETTLATAA